MFPNPRFTDFLLVRNKKSPNIVYSMGIDSTEVSRMKTKNAAPSIGLSAFLVMWVMATALGWLAAYILYELNLVGNYDDGIGYALLLTVVPGLPLALVQAKFVAPKFNVHFNFWLSLTVIGLLCSAATLFLLNDISRNFDDPRLLFTALFVPTAIVQWLFLLNNRAKGAWLWVIAAIISALLFNFLGEMLSDMMLDESLVIVIVAGVQSLVSGGVMWWLMQQPQTKAKKVKAV